MQDLCKGEWALIRPARARAVRRKKLSDTLWHGSAPGDAQGITEGFGDVTGEMTERQPSEQALRELSWMTIEAQDRERRRLSLSLTDSLLPSCAELIGHLCQARSRSEGEVSQRIDKSIALAEFLSREIRSASYLLYPPSLEADGLLGSLQAHLKGLATQKAVPIHTDFPAHLEPLPPPVAAALYRLVQEFLASMFRVPGNSRAKVRIAVEHARLKLEVVVEGRGLPEESVQEARRGIGELGVTIAALRERMVRHGGNLEIDSSRVRTWVTASLPVAGTRSLAGISPRQAARALNPSS